MSELTAKALSDSRSFENAILERDMRMKKAGWIVAALAGLLLVFALAALILLLPLLSFLFLGLAGMKLKPVVAGAIGTAVLAVVALLSYCTAFEYFSAGRDASGVFPTLVPWNTVWLPISRTLHIDLGILLDPISVMMLVVISTVSLMVHVYSLGYMAHDERKRRFFGYLNLFIAAMMLLVLAAIAIYALTLAPVTWVLLSEIFPNRVRGMAISLGTLALWIACFLLTYTFPLLNAGLGAAGSFLLYGIICALGFIYILRNVPETKGVTLEALETQLAQRHGVAPAVKQEQAH